MMRRHLLIGLLAAGLAGCATTTPQDGTLAELDAIPADIEEVQLADGLERAEQSYRRYLEETSGSARTPEAMRRLADLQIEQEYGVIGGSQVTEMAAPKAAAPAVKAATAATSSAEHPVSEQASEQESEQDFERRASGPIG